MTILAAIIAMIVFKGPIKALLGSSLSSLGVTDTTLTTGKNLANKLFED